jgi:IS30 family transposase
LISANEVSLDPIAGIVVDLQQLIKLLFLKKSLTFYRGSLFWGIQLFKNHYSIVKGKCKPNRHQEKRGKQAFRRLIHQRNKEYSNYSDEFGHLEGDRIVGAKHKSTVITSWWST